MLIIVPGRESIAAAKRTGSAEEDADRENILTMAVWYHPCRLRSTATVPFDKISES